MNTKTNIIDFLWILVKTSRPIAWFIGPLIFLFGFFMAKAQFDFVAILQIIFLSFPLCIMLYGINDIYDYESDKINKRKKLWQGIILEKKYHEFIRISSLVAAVLFLIVSLLTYNLQNIALSFLLLFFGYYYSAKPIRFKEIPLADSITNGLIFLLTFALGFSFNASVFEIPLKMYLVALSFSGIHALGAMMDYTSDKKTHQKTVAVVLGKRFAAFFCFLSCLLTFIFANIQTTIINYYLLFCSLLALIIFFYPSEKLASLFIKLIVAGFFMIAVIFILMTFLF